MKKKKHEKKVDTGVQFDKLNVFSEDTDWSGLEHELKQQDWVSEFRSAVESRQNQSHVKLTSGMITLTQMSMSHGLTQRG